MLRSWRLALEVPAKKAESTHDRECVAVFAVSLLLAAECASVDCQVGERLAAGQAPATPRGSRPVVTRHFYSVIRRKSKGHFLRRGKRSNQRCVPGTIGHTGGRGNRHWYGVVDVASSQGPMEALTAICDHFTIDQVNECCAAPKMRGDRRRRSI